MSAVATARTATDQFREKAGELKEDLKEMGHLAPDVAREKFEHLKQSASAAYEKGKDCASDTKQSVEAYIRERPIQTVLIAAGAGMLLGYLISRSRR